jgi:hypothetical protein
MGADDVFVWFWISDRLTIFVKQTPTAIAILFLHWDIYVPGHGADKRQGLCFSGLHYIRPKPFGYDCSDLL